jgi:3-oxoacyl-[acyl-carrier protein] reductase
MTAPAGRPSQGPAAGALQVQQDPGDTALPASVRYAGAPSPGRKLLVAGGCGGIGRALVSEALALGLKVAVLDLAASIAAHPDPRVTSVAFDATDPASVEEAVSQAALALGGIDDCVNLVGFMTPMRPLAETPPELWHEVIRGNLDSAFLLSRAVLPHLHRSQGGSLVHTASGLGAWPRPNYGAYGPAKAGLLLLMRELALENAPSVRINAVAPGAVDTAFLRGGTGRSDEQQASSLDEATYRKLVPLGRIATPADVVGPILFLLSPAASYMTGQTLFINGGAYMP